MVCSIASTEPGIATPLHNDDASRFLCLGIPRTHNIDADRKAASDREKAMTECMSPDDLAAFKGNVPRDYPCPVNMASEASHQHNLAGRDTEISWHMFKVGQCGCCGRV